MIGRRLLLGTGVIGLALLAGCGTSESVSQQSSGSQVSATASGSATNSDDPDTKHAILKSGFGLGDGGFAWVTALVRNDSNKSGATVVANFNLLDAGGQVVAIQLGVRAGGSQGSVVRSCSSASRVLIPHLVAVSR